MPNIQIDLDSKAQLNTAHAEYARAVGTIETLVEGALVFTGMRATGQIYLVSGDFADFLRKRGFPFDET